jgi:hypothetical protein
MAGLMEAPFLQKVGETLDNLTMGSESIRNILCPNYLSLCCREVYPTFLPCVSKKLLMAGETVPCLSCNVSKRAEYFYIWTRNLK